MSRRDAARWATPLGLCAAFALTAGLPAGAITTDPDDLANVEAVHGGRIEHCDELEDFGLEKDFEANFECGDELFETRFNAVDGVGANVGDGGRFTRVPRADLDGFGEWASHTPARATGPNSASCNGCHNQPFDDGAGEVVTSAIRDPFHTANPGQFIQRNTPSLFGIGGLQRLAEEMTEELDAIVEQTIAEAEADDNGHSPLFCFFFPSLCLGEATNDLVAKGVNFGSVTAKDKLSGPTEVIVDAEGIDDSLVLAPLQWKGAVRFVRDFNRGASHNELGMQAVEITGDGVDGDADGVVDEMSVADQSALAVYVAAQPRPVTTVELDFLRQMLEALGPNGEAEAEELGLPTLSAADQAAIANGEQVFSNIGCEDCHRSQLVIDDPIFSEPSQNPNYRDNPFPAGQDPLARGVDPNDPITFDLTADQPDNVIEVDGMEVAHLGPFENDGQGGAVVRLFSDLKRHDMGPGLAENIDETGTGASTWITKELWGLGSTDQFLHDGRATTIKEAILEHGGEAAASKAAFDGLSAGDEDDLIAFLESLVLFKVEEEE